MLLALAAAVLSLLITLPFATRLEPKLGDYLVMSQLNDEKQASSDKIVIVAITEETLAGFSYRSPIDRGFLANLIMALDKARPAAIGVDILLDGPSDPVKDTALLAAIDGSKTPVVLASIGVDAGMTASQVTNLDAALAGRRHGSVVLQRDEADGILRHLPILRDAENAPVATFAEVLLGQNVMPGNLPNRILYQFQADGSSAFPIYPAHTVSFLPADWFAGKYVLIGTALPAIDQHPTPGVSLAGSAAGTSPGIAIHGQILAQLLDDRRLPAYAFWHMVALAALAALAAALLFQLTDKPRLVFVVLGLAIVAYLAVAFFALKVEAFLLPVFAPPVAAIGAALLLSLYRWRVDRLKQAFLRTAFSRYVSPAVVKRLASGHMQLTLGGEKRMVTYIFTDLEGFTSLSENLPPDQMAKLLNDYLDKVCDVITEHGATIDKIIGDAVVCFFGAPEECPDQASRAVKLVLALDAVCEEFRHSANAEGVALGVTRIGAHRGEAAIGNFGGSRFFDYTGIGDTVNTAARLEGANRFLGTRICVSSAVADPCDGVVFRPLGALVVKGRGEAVSCFEPMHQKAAEEPWAKTYMAAFRALDEGRSEAMSEFEKTNSLNPEDGPALFHLDRLRAGDSGTRVVLSGK